MACSLLRVPSCCDSSAVAAALTATVSLFFVSVFHQHQQNQHREHHDLRPRQSDDRQAGCRGPTSFVLISEGEIDEYCAEETQTERRDGARVADGRQSDRIFLNPDRNFCNISEGGPATVEATAAPTSAAASSLFFASRRLNSANTAGAASEKAEAA